MDRLTTERRSWLMSRVPSKDSAPELVVRRMLHRNGYRYRLHVAQLPGKPDIVFPRRRAVVFVHGCFWHGHGCRIGQLPKSRPEFWVPKLTRNRERDIAATHALEALGWRVATIWQCEIKDVEALGHRLGQFLNQPTNLRSTLPTKATMLASQRGTTWPKNDRLE